MNYKIKSKNLNNSKKILLRKIILYIEGNY